MRLAMAPAICFTRMIALSLLITTEWRSFSVEDLGLQATKYFPLWYWLYSTFPDIGILLICTFAGLINIEICKRLSLKYSGSIVSSITTTFPSAGQITWWCETVKFLFGDLKNEMTNISIIRLTLNTIHETTGISALKK